MWQHDDGRNLWNISTLSSHYKTSCPISYNCHSHDVKISNPTCDCPTSKHTAGKLSTANLVWILAHLIYSNTKLSLISKDMSCDPAVHLCYPKCPRIWNWTLCSCNDSQVKAGQLSELLANWNYVHIFLRSVSPKVQIQDLGQESISPYAIFSKTGFSNMSSFTANSTWDETDHC
jgi:hypothetical protein